MATIFHEADGDLQRLEGETIAVVGYGNQGRSWALNLRDSGCSVDVCVRADASRERAKEDGFEPKALEAANAADVLCLLVPDDVIPSLLLSPSENALTIAASGYCFGFERLDVPGDLGMVAPRMLGPEVRACYEEGVGFITAVGVHRDATGDALARVLAVAKAIGGLRQGAIELTPKQEAVLDLAVEQVLSPALTFVNSNFVTCLTELGLPIEAILAELFLSGEVERNYRLLREVGFVGQLGVHSPASQYGQLSRRGSFDHLDIGKTMRQLLDPITTGRFADEWDTVSADGYRKLEELIEAHAGPGIKAFEDHVRRQLGPEASTSKS